MTTCPYVCNNKTAFGYCCSTVCINPMYNQRTINSGLTADYVQVVRCKDCKFNSANQIPNEDVCQLCVELPISKDFYCAYGERKDNERNKEPR